MALSADLIQLRAGNLTALNTIKTRLTTRFANVSTRVGELELEAKELQFELGLVEGLIFAAQQVPEA